MASNLSCIGFADIRNAESFSKLVQRALRRGERLRLGARRGFVRYRCGGGVELRMLVVQNELSFFSPAFCEGRSVVATLSQKSRPEGDDGELIVTAHIHGSAEAAREGEGILTRTRVAITDSPLVDEESLWNNQPVELRLACCASGGVQLFDTEAEFDEIVNREWRELRAVREAEEAREAADVAEIMANDPEAHLADSASTSAFEPPSFDSQGVIEVDANKRPVPSWSIKGWGVQSFVPTGMLRSDVGVGTADVFLNGFVREALWRLNDDADGGPFWSIAVETCGFTLTVLCDPEDLPREPKSGDVISVHGWLHADLASICPARSSDDTLSRIFGA